MEIFVGGSAVQIRDLDRSQEFRVLYEGTKVESETGKIGFIFV